MGSERKKKGYTELKELEGITKNYKELQRIAHQRSNAKSRDGESRRRTGHQQWKRRDDECNESSMSKPHREILNLFTSIKFYFILTSFFLSFSCPLLTCLSTNFLTSFFHSLIISTFFSITKLKSLSFPSFFNPLLTCL